MAVVFDFFASSADRPEWEQLRWPIYPEEANVLKNSSTQQIDESEKGGISQALGTLGATGAALSYLLVYVFRLGEAIRFRFDPSLITVSINDFLTVLTPTATCLTYFVFASILMRDLGDEGRAKKVLGAQLSGPGAVVVGLVLSILPVGLTLLVGSVQTSIWVSLVVAALASMGILCLTLRHLLHVSPITWASGVFNRGSRRLGGAPSHMGAMLGAAALAMLLFFLVAGYTNQLDFSGSHTLVIESEESGEDYAVLALFDGNRAVTRIAEPTDAEGTFQVNLDDPYQVTYITDGYVVTTAHCIRVIDEKP